MDGHDRSVLDPVERVSEILFGLIMVLSFTGSLSVATAGHEEVRMMLIGAIGCNLAWGIVDGTMYVLTSLVTRRRGLRIVELVRAADPEAGRNAIAAELPPLVVSVMRPSDIESVRQGLVALPASPPPRHLTSVTWQDVRGAVETFLLVFLCTFPVAVPFLFLSNPFRALRISNAVALAMLFLGGYTLGRHSGVRPWKLGLSMAAVGVALVAITIALGG